MLDGLQMKEDVTQWKKMFHPSLLLHFHKYPLESNHSKSTCLAKDSKLHSFTFICSSILCILSIYSNSDSILVFGQSFKKIEWRNNASSVLTSKNIIWFLSISICTKYVIVYLWKSLGGQSYYIGNSAVNIYSLRRLKSVFLKKGFLFLKCLKQITFLQMYAIRYFWNKFCCSQKNDCLDFLQKKDGKTQR